MTAAKFLRMELLLCLSELTNEPKGKHMHHLPWRAIAQGAREELHISVVEA
jgi:hypothetical protein